MFETGQPNHTFDASFLKSDTVSVILNGQSGSKPDSKKQNLHSETFVTLDAESRTLPAEAILILDGDAKNEIVLTIGGIMGGQNSEIKPDTTELFIESATFPRDKIRFSLAKLQLRTDAAIRFEKGQDPKKAKTAIYRIIELLKKVHPDIQAGEITGEAPVPERRNEIRTTLSFIQNRLGFPITRRK